MNIECFFQTVMMKEIRSMILTEKIFGFLSCRSPGFILLISICFAFGIGYLDYITGRDLEVDIFYLIPVFITVWFATPKLGIAMSVFSMAIWFAAYLPDATPGLHWAIHFWNALIELISFLIVVWLLAVLKKQNIRLEQMAYQDSLTGIANRRAFFQAAAVEINRSGRYGSVFSVAYIDLDNFKMINDTYGHQSGDILLKQVADTIRRHIRNIDTVARLGGDEFALLLPEAGIEGAKGALKKIRQLLLEIMRISGYPVTFSVGVVTFVKPPASVDEMIRKADDMMYSVKKKGKNAIYFDVWTPTEAVT